MMRTSTKLGDTIEITESRPLSKTKNWVATRLVQKPLWCNQSLH